MTNAMYAAEAYQELAAFGALAAQQRQDLVLPAWHPVFRYMADTAVQRFEEMGAVGDASVLANNLKSVQEQGSFFEEHVPAWQKVADLWSSFLGTHTGAPLREEANEGDERSEAPQDARRERTESKGVAFGCTVSVDPSRTRGLPSRRRSAAVDCTPVNAVVPPGYRDKLTFVPRDVNVASKSQETWMLPLPKQWYVDSTGGFVGPAADSSKDEMLYGKSRMDLATVACQHDPCPQLDAHPPDDVTIVSSHEEDYERSGQHEHRRVVVGREEHAVVPDDGLYVDVYWWTVEARSYHHCSVRLAPEVKDATDAFEKACELSVVRR